MSKSDASTQKQLHVGKSLVVTSALIISLTSIDFLKQVLARAKLLIDAGINSFHGNSVMSF